MSRSVESRFLNFYDKKPLMASLFGLTSLFIAFAFIGVSTAAINKLAGLPTLILVFLLSPVFIYLVKPIIMIVFLANEFVWKSLGIYYSLGIKGLPIRERYSQGSEMSDGR